MKIGVKMIIFWIASLALFAGAGVVFLLYPDLLSGVQGPFICFFLGYCGIIVVAQAFSFIEMIRSARQDSPEKSRRYQTETGSA